MGLDQGNKWQVRTDTYVFGIQSSGSSLYILFWFSFLISKCDISVLPLLASDRHHLVRRSTPPAVPMWALTSLPLSSLSISINLSRYLFSQTACEHIHISTSRSQVCGCDSVAPNSLTLLFMYVLRVANSLFPHKQPY